MVKSRFTNWNKNAQVLQKRRALSLDHWPWHGLKNCVQQTFRSLQVDILLGTNISPSHPTFESMMRYVSSLEGLPSNRDHQIIAFLVGNSYKPSSGTVIGWRVGPEPNYKSSSFRARIKWLKTPIQLGSFHPLEVELQVLYTLVGLPVTGFWGPSCVEVSIINC